MTNEEKILAILEKQGQLLSDIATGQAALEGRIGRLEDGQAALGGRIGRLEDGQAAVSSQLERIETDISGIKVRLDADIQKQLDTLEEGDEAITERLDRLSQGLDRVEAMTEDTKAMVDVLYTVVKQHSGEISELKKAQ